LGEVRCQQMQSGDYTPAQEVTNLATANGGDGIYGLTSDQAGEFIGAAMRSYCPEVGAKYGLKP
jgi:hypothetical protein